MTAELDAMEVNLMDARLMAVKLETMRLRRKSKNLSKSKKTVGSDFLTPRVKLAFTELRQAFVKSLILHHFDPERHIRIETDVSSYAIGGVLSQLTSDDLGR